MDTEASETLRILVAHEISYPLKVIYEVHEFPELLALRGHNVTFVDFAEGYRGRPGKNLRSWRQKGRVYPSAEIELCSPWLSGIAPIDRLVAVLTVWGVLWSLRRGKFDVILNFAVPTYGLQMMLFGLFKRIPVIHRALDVSHKIRVSPWNPLISIVERLVLTLSTAISANNPAMADYARSRSWRRGSEIHVNYPPTGNADWRRIPFSEELARDYGISKEDFVIAYLGSFFYFSGLDQVIRGFAEATKQRSDIRLLLIGGGEQDQLLRRLVKDLHINHLVTFTGFVNYDKIPDYLSLAAVAINPMEISDVSNYALPNKVIQYLQLGLPVISTALKGLRSALPDEPLISWVTSSEDVIARCLDIESLPFTNGAQTSSNSNSLKKFEPELAVKNLESLLELTALRSRFTKGQNR